MSRSKPTMRSAQNLEKPEPSTSNTGREVVKQVTAQVLKFEVDKTRCVRIEDKMHVSTRRGNSDDKRKMEPATVCSATDIDTGETGTIVLNKVLMGNLADSYPDDSYVGRYFEITKREKKKGGKFEYWPFDIVEVKPGK